MLPEEPTEARRISKRAGAYRVINGELYKKSLTGVLQRCIAPEDGRRLLLEIHEGICGHHAGSRTLVAMQDAKDIVKTCNTCQCFTNKPVAPATEVNTIPIAWPFAQWGLDMVGKLHKSSKGGHVYLLVAVDKFTKWIEAGPVAN